MTKENGYGWIIYRDWVNVSGPGHQETKIIGPSDCPFTEEELMKGQRFRLYDDDEELYYEGRSLGTGEYEDSEEYYCAPLDDFGMPNDGCSAIKHCNPETKKMEYVIG